MPLVEKNSGNLIAVGAGSWTTGGPGTVTVDPVTGALTIKTDGTSPTYARRSVTTEIGKKYSLSWSLDTTLVTFRYVGSTAGGSDLVPYNASAVGDNRREFTATTTTTWIELSRSTAATATTTSNFILEKIPESGRVARRLNGRSQFFAIDAQQSGLRVANSNFFIGGWVNFTYMPAASVYLADFGRLDPASTGGGASRIRLFWDAANTKLALSTSDVQGSIYRENYVVTQLMPGGWYYIGAIVKANADVQLVLDGQLSTSYIGTTVPPLSATEICRVLHVGARVVSPATNFAPVRYADWIWCSNWLPTTDHLNSLASGVRPHELAGFTPPSGANLYHWPMEAGSGDELTKGGGNPLIALPSATTPGLVGGPDTGAVVDPATATFPLDIIIV